MNLSIVLVSNNDREFLEPCLHSLLACSWSGGMEIVVVDNGSCDGTQEMLRESFPTVMLMENKENVGLGKASNQGIMATSGAYLLLLNNDTLVNCASLTSMVAFMESQPDAGAVGGRLVNPDGSFQAAHARFSSLGQEFLIATRLGELLFPGYPAHLDEVEVKSVDWLSSACLLLRRSALDDVGLLDEDYFIYGDETDLQLRMWRAGWKIYYLPHATTIHYGGRSMDRWRRRRMVYRGKMLFYRKNYGLVRSAALRALIGALSIVKMIIWAPALVHPNMRLRAKGELRSNLEVAKLTVVLQ